MIFLLLICVIQFFISPVVCTDWESVKPDICYNPFINSLPDGFCSDDCWSCIQTDGTKHDGRSWCDNAVMTLTPDPAITLYVFPDDEIKGGMCTSGSYFRVTPSGTFNFQNYTVSFTMTCNDLVSMPYYMQCDFSGLYVMLAPLLTILFCCIMTIITVACCVHYRKQTKLAKEKRRNAPIKPRPENEEPPPKPPAAEPERTAAPENSALNFMMNKQIDLDAYVATKKEETKPLVTETKPKRRNSSQHIPDLPPAPPPPVRPVQNTFYNQADDEIEMSQTNEDQSENLVVGGQVNLDALGFQEEFF
jgi:hypothetical protein